MSEPLLSANLRRTLILGMIALASSFAARSVSAQPPADAPAPAAPLLSAPTKPIAFDIAVFRINKSGSNDMPYLQIPVGGDGFVAQDRPIHDIIRYAFAKGRGASFRISGQPSWVDDDRYDMQAKVAVEDLPEWQKLDAGAQKLVLQAFLIQYLKLKFHPDPTPYPYYALVVAKGGPKFQAAKPGASYKGPGGQTITGRSVAFSGPNEVTVQDAPIGQFADFLSPRADRVVLNKTDLDGPFDFVVQFDEAVDANPNMPAGMVRPFFSLPPEVATPLMFSAVKKLGLQLVPTKGPIDAIVIDHIERPEDN